MTVSLLTHIFVTRPQWVNRNNSISKLFLNVSNYRFQLCYCFQCAIAKSQQSYNAPVPYPPKNTSRNKHMHVFVLDGAFIFSTLNRKQKQRCDLIDTAQYYHRGGFAYLSYFHQPIYSILGHIVLGCWCYWLYGKHMSIFSCINPSIMPCVNQIYMRLHMILASRYLNVVIIC